MSPSVPPPPSAPPGPRSVRPAPVLGAASFSAMASDPSAIVAAIREARATLTQPSGAVIFASGSLVEAAERTLLVARRELGDIPIILGSSAGVLTERGEHEGSSAVSGLVWQGGVVSPIFVPPRSEKDTAGDILTDRVATALGDASGTVILLAQPQGFSPRTLDSLARFSAHATIIGGGTLPGGAWISMPDQKRLQSEAKPQQGEAVGLVVRGIARPVVRTSSACRLLSPLLPITEVRGAMVFRLGDRPALEVLSESTHDLSGRPLVLAILARNEDDKGARGGMLVRGIRGVDSGRKSVVIAEEAAPGMLMAFGICDANASRADLSATTRELSRQMAGAAPQFGLLISCAGRGSGLYGERDVDSRIVRERFPNVPFAGMFSSFEIGPLGDRTAMHLYTGVVAMFGAPS
ncbi:MAG TPA: FIST C-terminal domain-containing protein [Polyangiaceae bacterium]|nr:FIST C-terminal domain-containing protein [Polyangiaceae bacterium]